jgi:hypothetical protein
MRWDDAKRHVALARRTAPKTPVKRDALASMDTMIARAQQNIAPRSDPAIARASLTQLPPLPVATSATARR